MQTLSHLVPTMFISFLWSFGVGLEVMLRFEKKLFSFWKQFEKGFKLSLKKSWWIWSLTWKLKKAGINFTLKKTTSPEGSITENQSV